MSRLIKSSTNQALKLALYAKSFMKIGKPSHEVLERTKLFHTDSIICGASALALRTNAPTILKDEALDYCKQNSSAKTHQKGYARCIGSNKLTLFEKAVVANCAAVREWDSNGTVFGYRQEDNNLQAGEFGHNDFYPLIIALSGQGLGLKSNTYLKAMVLHDEIRGRLSESFSLKTYKIDHVVHGGIATCVVYGTLMGASPEQIEEAIGMYISHYIPYRALRAGEQLSDSKGASAAIATEAAIMCIRRTMRGFKGPKDIFRNPQAIFRLNEPTSGDSPFDIKLGFEGDDFSVMGMHFKLGLYEHQSAGAIEGVLKAIFENKFIEQNNFDNIDSIEITSYEPAFGIIGDPAKRNPTTRQSADHSMVYIISTLLNKAITHKDLYSNLNNLDDIWKKLFLSPYDYSYENLNNDNIKKLMDKISFKHGGKEYDEQYPDGIPTSVKIKLTNETEIDSGFIKYPSGHARNQVCNLKDILNNKFEILGSMAFTQDKISEIIDNLNNFDTLDLKLLPNLYNFDLKYADKSIDDI